VTTLADRLRQMAECLPPGASVTITRDGLLELAAEEDGDDACKTPQADLTVGELAARLHRAASTVREWCEHGRFAGAYKLNGRDWRVPLAALDAFLAGQRNECAVVRLGAWRAVRRADVAGR
jgi:excisionase family DNA binding protein